MGLVNADILLRNVKDIIKTEVGILKEPEIRQTSVRAIVDTGAVTLVINENLRQQLGLELQGTKQATLANDTKETVKVADPVEVHWKNRRMICQPWVIRGSGEVL